MFHRDSLACTSEIAGPCLTPRSTTIEMAHSILTQQHQFAVVVSCASAVGTSELDDKDSNASTTKQFPAPPRFMIDACNAGTNWLFSLLSGMSRFNLSCVFCFMVYCGHILLFLHVLLHVSLFDRVFSQAETPPFSSYNSWSCCWKGTVWIITVYTRQQC